MSENIKNGLEHCKIDLGDVLYLKPMDELKYLDQQNKLYFGWNDCMQELYSSMDGIVIDQEVYDNLHKIIPYVKIVEINNERYYLGQDMVNLVKKENIGKFKNSKDSLYLTNINKDDVLKEMIGKVDRVRFKKLLCLAGNIKFSSMSDKIVNKYLEDWAEAKYEFYCMFGNNLFIEKEIETQISDEELKYRIRGLCETYPEIALFLTQIPMYNLQKNELPDNKLFKDVFGSKYKIKSKVTGFISDIWKNKEILDQLAMILTDKYIKTKMRVSIDPYDYMTISTNRHGWTSCTCISKISPYITQTGAILLDDCTTVGYLCDGKDKEYNAFGISFEGNSKSWRQLVMIDKNSCGVIFNRQYPQEISIVEKEMRNFVEDTISSYLNVTNEWTISKNIVGYERGSHTMYHDVIANLGTPVSVKLNANWKDPMWIVGEDPICVNCGSRILDHNESLKCSNCS